MAKKKNDKQRINAIFNNISDISSVSFIGGGNHGQSTRNVSDKLF
jgi:hypothetical protein